MAKRTGTYFEDDVDFTFTPCRDPEHEPPGHIVIPQGKKLVHICPSCKNKTVIRAESFSLTASPAITYQTTPTKPLSEVKPSDVPRGLSPDDVATTRRPSHKSAYETAKTPRKNITNRGWR